MSRTKWIMLGPVLAMVAEAGLILKHVPVMTSAWLFELLALLFVVATYYWAKRRGEPVTTFLGNVIVLFIANTAWVAYLLRHS